MWRASFNTECLDPKCIQVIPEVLYVALFGHTKAINADYYPAKWKSEDMLGLVTERGHKEDSAAVFKTW